MCLFCFSEETLPGTQGVVLYYWTITFVQSLFVRIVIDSVDIFIYEEGEDTSDKYMYINPECVVMECIERFIHISVFYINNINNILYKSVFSYAGISKLVFVCYFCDVLLYKIHIAYISE